MMRKLGGRGLSLASGDGHEPRIRQPAPVAHSEGELDPGLGAMPRSAYQSPRALRLFLFFIGTAWLG